MQEKVPTSRASPVTITSVPPVVDPEEGVIPKAAKQDQRNKSAIGEQKCVFCSQESTKPGQIVPKGYDTTQSVASAGLQYPQKVLLKENEEKIKKKLLEMPTNKDQEHSHSNWHCNLKGDSESILRYQNH